jgi:uncharacterized membrane protein
MKMSSSEATEATTKQAPLRALVRQVPPRVEESITRPRSATTVGLGCLSVTLGLAELLAPRALARLTGVRDDVRTRWIVRALGARELAVGIGLLADRRPSRWLWARVAGDVVDLALLGAAARQAGAERPRALGAIGAVVGITALDAACAATATKDDHARAAVPVRKSITIARPPEEVFRLWRALEKAPTYLANIESVEVLDARRSRWTARGPVGPVVTWESVITEEQPNAALAWKSTDSSDVHTSGRVTFESAPGERGTEVHLELRYGPPRHGAGKLGAFLWKTSLEPMLERDLARFKQLLETGHIVQSDASLHRGPHPARPSAVTGGLS